MKKLMLFILIFSLHSNLIAKKIYCQFEEVYQNGETQQGQIFLSDEKLRYEYFDKNLFTLLFVNKNLFQIENKNPHKVQLINNFPIINDLFLIYSKFPNIKNSYKQDGYEILIDKHSSFFIKRLAVKSNRLNLSIHFLECEEKIIQKKYFNFNPFIEYVPS